MADDFDPAGLDAKPWGFIEDGQFVELPKLPMLRAGFTKPPFDVQGAFGTRHVIVKPDAEVASEIPTEGCVDNGQDAQS